MAKGFTKSISLLTTLTLAAPICIPDSINIKQLAFFGLLNDVLTKKVRPILLAQIADLEQQGKLVGPLEIRAMALKQSAMVRSEISSFQDKIAAVTGVVMCSKIF